MVLKPSVNTPESAVVFAEIAGEIFPPGVFNLVLGTGETERLYYEIGRASCRERV